MKPRRIKELLDELPEDSLYVRAMTGRSNTSDILGYALQDTKFVWRFAHSFVASDQPLPAMAAEEEWISRAYAFLAYNVFDEVVSEALMIEGPYQRRQRDVLRALLVIKDMPFEQIAEKCDNISVDVVIAYEALFWNVRDRLTEDNYMASIIYPDGLQSECRENYLIKEDLGTLMLKAARAHGEQPMNALAGRPTTEHQSETNSADFGGRIEAFTMSNGLLMAKLGMLNQRGNPGVSHAKALLVAAKQGGNVEASMDDQGGLGQLGIAHAIASDILRIQEKDIKFRTLMKSKLAQQDAATSGKFLGS